MRCCCHSFKYFETAWSWSDRSTFKKGKQILLVQDFSKNCQKWILEMFLKWNTAESKFFEALAKRVFYHFLFVPFVFYLARGI